jgi:hypothetical protein
MTSLMGFALIVAGPSMVSAQFGPPKTPSKLRSVPAETTAAKVKDPNWKAPRTAWGAPDLTGIWTSDDMRGVPATRPAAQKDRESLTPEEFQRRAGGDEASRDRAVNQETVLRNEFGVRTFGYTSFVVEPPDGQLPALTPAGQAKQRASFGVGTFGGGPFNDFSNFSLYDRCITRGIAGIFPVLYGNGLRIMQTPNEVIVSYEMIHDTRVIPLDGRPHVGAKIEQYMGDSRGHWEGDTLVVETTNFTDRVGAFNGPNSDRLKVTERFTRIDPQMIDYRIRVEDPVMYAAPFTIATITQQPTPAEMLPCPEERRVEYLERRARTEGPCGRDQGPADSARAGGDGSVHGRSGRRPRGGS